MELALRSILSWWDSVGVDVPDVKSATPSKRLRTASAQNRDNNTNVLRDNMRANMATDPVTSPPATPLIEQVLDVARAANTLEDLAAKIAAFDAGELSQNAQQSVFSRGNPDAGIMIIGEAPGHEEDIKGRPFVGPAGQLLDRMFAAIGMSDEDIYITNVINWRPSGNRNPTPDELAHCKPFIDRHIELVDPTIIVLVGGTALRALTGQTGIMKNRGQWTTLTVKGRDVPTIPIYHPAFLLRQPALKKDAWRDLLSLRERVHAI